jgi:hypothetical protein
LPLDRIVVIEGPSHSYGPSVTDAVETGVSLDGLDLNYASWLPDADSTNYVVGTTDVLMRMTKIPALLEPVSYRPDKPEWNTISEILKLLEIGPLASVGGSGR